VPGGIDPVALALFNAPSVKGEPGKWLIPNANPNAVLRPGETFNAFIPGTATFIGDQAVANLDYNATSKDTLALKYYYQHDPTVAPYAYSNVPASRKGWTRGRRSFPLTTPIWSNPTSAPSKRSGTCGRSSITPMTRLSRHRTFRVERTHRHPSIPSDPLTFRGSRSSMSWAIKNSGNFGYPQHRPQCRSNGIVHRRFPKSPPAFRECDLASASVLAAATVNHVS